MRRTRQQLDSMLERLEDKLPTLMQTYGEQEFLAAFAGEVNIIEDSAGPGDAEYVRGRVNCMLSSRGLIPGENEGETCT